MQIHATFTVGSRIKVVDKASKHFGREVIISSVGKARLTVKFVDGRVG